MENIHLSVNQVALQKMLTKRKFNLLIPQL